MIRGGAWCESWCVEYLGQFRTTKYYNSSVTYNPGRWGAGIPVVRTTQSNGSQSKHAYINALPWLVANGYQGPVKLFNECEFAGQDDAPLASHVQQYYDACRIVDGHPIWFVAGNYVYHVENHTFPGKVHDGCTVSFLQNCSLRSVDRLGIHIYPTGKHRHPWRITQEIRRLTAYKAPIWISEYGLLNSWSVWWCKLFVNLFIERNPFNVEAAFYYAPAVAHGEDGVHGTYANKKRALTNSGKALA